MGSIGLEEPRGVATPETAEAHQKGTPLIVSRPWAAGEMAIVLSLAAGACLLHLLVNIFAAGRYGLFRDELYYLACAEHLDWGYVDHAPLVALLAWFSRSLLGNSLVALRLLPAFAGAAKILVTAWIVRELGGGRFAQLLAGVTVLLAPIYLVFDNLLTMNAFEPVFWMLGAAIVMRITRGGDARLWLLFGLVAGIGLLNKHSMLFFGSGVLVGLLLTPERRFLRSRWIWLGALVSFLLFSPNLLWEIRHHWPTIENLRNVRENIYAPVTPIEFILQQALLVLPLATPIWLAGLYSFLGTSEGKRYRLLGWTYLVVLAELLMLKGKIYYLAPAYPMLLAAGAVWIAGWIRERRWNWWKPALVVPLAVAGTVAAPLALPMLPVEATASYAKFWRADAVKVESPDSGRLPQLFAEMFGWQNQAATVARVYHSLSAEDQVKCAILAGNFGEAGAIDFFAQRYGLPKAISGNNSYYLWGPRNYSGEVMVSIGVPRRELEALFGQVEQAATIVNKYAVPDEANLPVYICRKPKMPVREAWPKLKNYG